MTDVPDFSSGEELSAVKLNALARVLRKLTFRARPPLYITETPDGAVLEYRDAQEADFRVAGGTNPYAGVELRPTAGGGWADLAGGRSPSAGSDPLYERNGSSTVAVGARVRARRDPQSGAWIFDRSSCSSAPATTTTPAPKPSPAPNALGPELSPPRDLEAARAGLAPFLPTWAGVPLNVRAIDRTGGDGGLSTMTGGGGGGGPS